jgi:RNA polymerase sigma-70 factor (ECF subfamily)
MAAATSLAQLEDHRVALTGHCYRMLGSAAEADDAVQETMVRAWKAIDRFEERSSMRTWLYRIATNVCLDALEAAKKRRARPIDGPLGTTDDELVSYDRTHWLEPIPDAKAIPSDADPAEAAILRESIRLAFVHALQSLPARQRAALLLSEVLGWSAAEIADSLEMSVPAVNSALQRARATLASPCDVRAPKPLTDAQKALVDRYEAAFATYDVEGLVSLLRDDAKFCMPPYALWLRGPDPVRAWLLGRGSGCRGSKLIRTAACGMPAFGQYRIDPEGGYKAFSLTTLELDDRHVVGWTSFLDVETLFPRFGLPLKID